MNNPFIIAELGINHNGSIEIAKKLIDMAKECGCDAVKFQKRTIDTVYSSEFLDSPRESPWGDTQRAQKEGLEFGKEEYDEIDEYCTHKEIFWFASAWDLKSQEFLKQYKNYYNKIASPMLTNEPLLEMVAEEGKYTFISTGMSTMGEIGKAVHIFDTYNCPFHIMHCNSSYPAPTSKLNLSMITTLKRFYCDVGYSGHEVSVLPSVVAVVLGAIAIERHITLDRAMYGTDQAASLERKGLEMLVRDARQVSVILGNGTKRITQEEMNNAEKLRYFERSEKR